MLNTAIQAALEAGEAILEIYARDFEVEYKADESPLTAADTAAHNIIIKALESTPYPILSEESGGIGYEERREWKTFWLVDPLDGTKEFIKKNDEFTVNIALIEEGIPVMGVVYAPVLQTIYYGVQDVGSRMLDVGCESGKALVKMDGMTAWKAEQCAGKSVTDILASAEPLPTSNISLSTQPRETKLRVVASRSHCNDETRAFIEALEQAYGAVELVSRGSSLKLCMIAEGAADIYPRIAPTMEWDTAAAHAVVAAAGGQVFEYDENLPVSSYVGSKKLDVEGGIEPPASRRPPPAEDNHPTSNILHPTEKTPRALRYNKENLLNPYFVVSALRE